MNEVVHSSVFCSFPPKRRAGADGGERSRPSVFDAEGDRIGKEALEEIGRDSLHAVGFDGVDELLKSAEFIQNSGAVRSEMANAV